MCTRGSSSFLCLASFHCWMWPRAISESNGTCFKTTPTVVHSDLSLVVTKWRLFRAFTLFHWWNSEKIKEDFNGVKEKTTIYNTQQNLYSARFKRFLPGLIWHKVNNQPLHEQLSFHCSFIFKSNEQAPSSILCLFNYLFYVNALWSCSSILQNTHCFHIDGNVSAVLFYTSKLRHILPSRCQPVRQLSYFLAVESCGWCVLIWLWFF